MPKLTPTQVRARPICEQIARGLAPHAWRQADESTDEGLIDTLTAESVQLAEELRSCLEALGFHYQPPQNLGEALERSIKAIAHTRDLLKPFKNETRGDLNDILSSLNALHDEITALEPEIACDECGSYSGDGEGFDGLCGSCADRASDDDGEAIAVEDIIEFEEDEGDPNTRYGAYHLHSQNEYRGIVFDLAGGIRQTTKKLYDAPAGAISAARRLAHGNEDYFSDADQIETDPANPTWSYTAVFYDDEDKWRGLWLVSNEPNKSTDLLYTTPALARAVARQIAHDHEFA